MPKHARPQEPVRDLNLGHMTIPQTSSSAAWMTKQANDREKARKIVAEVAREWLGGDSAHLPDVFFEMFADRVVTALDQRL
jgi:hypothetical protein